MFNPFRHKKLKFVYVIKGFKSFFYFVYFMTISRREFLTYIGLGALGGIAAETAGPIYDNGKILFNRFYPEEFSVEMRLSRMGVKINKPLDNTEERYGQVIIDDGELCNLRIKPKMTNPHELEYRSAIRTPAFYIMLSLNMYGRKYSIMNLISGIKDYDPNVDGTITRYYWIYFNQAPLEKDLPIDILIAPQFKNIARQPVEIEVGDSDPPKYANLDFELETKDGITSLYEKDKILQESED